MRLLEKLRQLTSFGRARATPPVPLPPNACPACRTPVRQADRYLAVYLNPGLRETCSQSSPASVHCNACAAEFATPLPVIYDDPELDLLVFVSASDGAELIQEFHHLLESCRDAIGEDRYDEAWRRPFQLTIGWAGLSRLIKAVQRRDAPVMKITPLLEGLLYENLFLRAAQVMEMKRGKGPAYDIVVRSSRYPVFSIPVLEQLAEVAKESGHLTSAAKLVEAAAEARGRSRHIWQKVLLGDPSGLTKIPEDLHLPLMEANLRHTYDIIRPSGYLWSELEAEVCGLAVGYLENALDALGEENMILGINLAHAQTRINDLLKETGPGDAKVLIGTFERARSEARQQC